MISNRRLSLSNSASMTMVRQKNIVAKNASSLSSTQDTSGIGEALLSYQKNAQLALGLPFRSEEYRPFFSSRSSGVSRRNTYFRGPNSCGLQAFVCLS